MGFEAIPAYMRNPVLAYNCTGRQGQRRPALYLARTVMEDDPFRVSR